VLRALFSMPDSEQRAKIGVMVRSYVTGPGRPNILDALARTEDAFSFASAKRRAFQRAWFATVDKIVGERRRLPTVMRIRDRNGPSVVVSTLCMVHNRFGRYYLSSITPFHKFGLRKLMASALAAHRL
jgi:Cft2 family RNA processing exonuclease